MIAKTEKLKTVKKEKAKRTRKMTVYMTDEQYLKWKEYEIKQLQAGKKVFFQGVVMGYLEKLCKK